MREWRLPRRLTRDVPRRHLRLSGATKLGIRIIISAALLAVLIIKIPADDIQPKDTHFGTLTFLAAGLAFTLVGFVLSAWRWQRVFAVFDVHVPLRTLLAHYLAGQFVGNVLPSTIGGDVLRVSRATKTTGTGDIAFASVVIERLSGFVALPLLSLLGFALEPSLLELDNAWIALAIAGATIVGLVVILLVAGSPRLAGRFSKHQNWMRFIGAVHVGVDRIRREPRQAVRVLVAAIVYQASVLVAVYCAIHALGISVPNGAVLAYLPAVASAQVLPDLAVGARDPRGSARAAAPPARRPHREGDRRRTALVRDDPGRQPARSACVRGRAPPRRRPRRRRAGARDGRHRHLMSVVEEDEPTAPTVPLHRRLPGGRTLRDGRPPLLVGRAPRGRASSTSSTRSSGTCTTATRAKRTSTRSTSSDWQKSLGINHEQAIQAWALGSRAFIIAANYFYGSLHFIVTGGVMIYLYRRWTDDYPRWRNTLGVATGARAHRVRVLPAAAAAAARPRAYGSSTTATGSSTRWPRTPRSGRSTPGAVNKISNQFAAMPSVHCAWALWCACALVPRLKHVWAKVLAALYPVTTVTVIVVTANHYFLDAVGGFFVLGVGYVAGPDLHPGRARACRRRRAGRRGGLRPCQSSFRFARCPRTRNPIANPMSAETAITRISGALHVLKSQSTPTSWVFRSANNTRTAPSSPNRISLTLTFRPSSCAASCCHALPPLRP